MKSTAQLFNTTLWKILTTCQYSFVGLRVQINKLTQNTPIIAEEYASHAHHAIMSPRKDDKEH